MYKKRRAAQLVSAGTITLMLFAFAPRSQSAAGGDLWIHPRGETFDPARHYQDAQGEVFFHAENDLHRGLGEVVVAGIDARSVTIALGSDLHKVIESSGGELVPVLLWDSGDDGAVDKSVRGRVDGDHAIFDAASLNSISFAKVHWQIGVRYAAGSEGAAGLDGRFLASVDSGSAEVEYRDGADLADVGAGPFGEGLVILKFREGNDFDLADFIENPGRYTESFDALSREEDGDDWTVDEEKEGRLVTHYDERDLFLVRTTGDMTLGVEWGDMPVSDFMSDYLQVSEDGKECYSSLNSQLVHNDGTPVEVPQTLLYCPGNAFALFEAPDGYEIELAAYRNESRYERTRAGTSIKDNIQLYVRQVHPRRPSARATGTVTGNIRAGFVDAGRDLGDAPFNLLTGTNQTNVHTGTERYKASLFTAIPLTFVALGRGQGGHAARTFFDGFESANLAVANVVSAVDNAVLNPLFQVTLGNLGDIERADEAGDYVGALTQTVVKNLPLGERFNDALNPASAYRHNRGYSPETHTRTDTQLNIDRIAAITNLIAINAIIRHNDNSTTGKNKGGDDGGGGGASGGPTPASDPPPVADIPPVADAAPPAPPPAPPAPAPTAPPGGGGGGNPFCPLD